MSEMVERVARAICSYPFDLYDRIKDDPNEANDSALLVEQMEGWRVMARAAIEAMREPTTGIVIAIAASLVCWEEVTPGEVWDSVIDEALK